MKESFFFSGFGKSSFSGIGSEYGQDIVEELDDYKKLFQDVKNEKAIGEACVAYLYFHERTINNLKTYLKETTRIIIVLRDPAERAFSNYRHHVRDRIESLSFEQAIDHSILEKRKNEKWWWGFQYIDVGYYYNQVNAYIKAFGNENVRIYLYEDLEESTHEVINDLFGFLGLMNNPKLDITTRYNVSEIPRSNNLQSFLYNEENKLKKALRPVVLNIVGRENTENLVNYLKNKNLLRINPRTRKRLIRLYKDDILRLENLIERDLSAWLR
ncbi:MAG TPA: sulfotransferase domain-containing protein [Thermodesulfobacteriota bacterium]|nr:sulfotransferase domain-containing protein [Thermodesulfobacteriota bacterium]